ncbi:hypothetical protein JCM10599A_54090 [Paraburkholderia kururiensis]
MGAGAGARRYGVGRSFHAAHGELSGSPWFGLPGIACALHWALFAFDVRQNFHCEWDANTAGGIDTKPTRECSIFRVTAERSLHLELQAVAWATHFVAQLQRQLCQGTIHPF